MRFERLIVYTKILFNLILMIFLGLFLFLIMPKLLKFFLPFVIGWIISMIANPLVRLLESRVKIVRKHSSAIIIVSAILLIVVAAALLITLIFREAKELIDNLPAIIDATKIQLIHLTDYIHKFTSALPIDIQKAVNQAISGIGDSLTEYISNLNLESLGGAGNIVGNIADGFLIVIVTILSAYFFTTGHNEMVEGLRKRLPASVVNYWRLIYDNFTAAFGGYFKAQFKIMLVLTLIMFIGFEILRVKYSFLFAFGIAFLDLLPVFGTGAVLWPWAVVDVISGNYFNAIGLVIIYLVCQVVKQLLQPKMVGDSIGLNPLMTLVFMFTGYRLYGILGMIIGIPVGMVLINMYRIGMFQQLIRGFKIIISDLNEFRKF